MADGNFLSDSDKWDRRKFVSTIVTAIGTSPLLAMPTTEPNKSKKNTVKEFTVQQIIDLIIATVPGAPIKNTVDTIKSGRPDQTVSGIVTTMFATDEVIEKTAALGANFIIAHEPTFYNHADDVSAFQQNEVYLYKKSLLEKHKIAIWRFHDYWHSHKPDGILMGVLTTLGWEKNTSQANPHLLTIEPSSLENIITHLKSKLNIEKVKVIGDKNQQIQSIAMLPGAAGGNKQISLVQDAKPDLLIVGELNEWETAEYIRDSRYAGSKQSLIVLGHAVSEEPGMDWLVSWLQPQIAQIKITHIPSGDPFQYL